MSNDGNGFADMADYLGNLSDAIPGITKQALEDAAKFYYVQLIPRIPKSLLKKMKQKHARDSLKVTADDEGIKVHFESHAFYWRFVENGTVNIRAQHFASGTYEQNKRKIEQLLTEKLLKELEG